jgi:tetratricopeptide (TPR) repeat protein
MNDRLAKLLSLFAADPGDTFVLYGIAQEHNKAGEHAKAIEFYDLALASDPAYCYAYYHKAQSQRAMGDLAGARQTALEGVQAAHKAGDGKALSELTNLQVELSEGAGG